MPRIRRVIPVSSSIRFRSRRTRLAVSLTGLVAGLALAAPAAASAYVSPFLGDTPIVGRTDMGVDVCLTPGDPIRAIGNGTVAGVMRNWYAGQPYIFYQLTGGPQVGRYVYVAEQIDRLARVGQSLQTGDVIARYAKSGSCLETGWSMADGETQAQAGTKRHRKHRTTPAPVATPTPQPKPAPKPKPTPAHKPTQTPAPTSTPAPGPGPYPGPNFGPGTEPYWPTPH